MNNMLRITMGCITSMVVFGMVIKANAEEINEKWVSCKSKDECQTIFDACDQAVAVNKTSIEIAKNYYAQIGCNRTSNYYPREQAFRLFCVENKCAFTTPDLKIKRRNNLI